MNDAMEKEVVDKYTHEGFTLRHLAEIFNTNHHKIRRILIKNGVQISRRKSSKKFSEEHKQKISDSRKKLKDSGYIPYNKGLKTIDRQSGKELLYKNMICHLRFDVNLDWLMKFDDFDKLKCLNRAITNRDGRFLVSSNWYVEYIEKFYHDEQFNKIYNVWKNDKNDKYLLPTLDHIVPKSNNGTNDLENLQFLSWFENRAKNNMTQQEWERLKANMSNYLT